MSINPRRQELIAVIRETREFLARPDNNFGWSPWDNAAAAIQVIDRLISQIESGNMPNRSEIEFLFLPTGPIQEVSVSSGWGRQFLRLADRFDSAVESAYSTGLLARLRHLVSPTCKHPQS